MTNAEIITTGVSILAMCASAASIVTNLYVRSIIAPIEVKIEALEAAHQTQTTDSAAKWKRIGELGERIAKLEGKL